MICPHCQAENTDTAKFCIDCGQPFHTESICPQCNHINKPTAKFCEECGYSLAEPTPAQTKPSTEPTSFADDRYKVKRKLGEGGKKKVYLVTDTRLNRDVAFALIKTENLDEDARKRVTREAQAMAKLGDHPNIMTIHDMGEEKGQPYIVIPEMSGGDVEGIINEAPEHRLPLEQAITISKSVCLGLEFAHSKGIVHRDIKPGNVWMSEDGTVKIGDFGLAMVTDVSRLTREGMMVGTVSYMPPEQAMGGEITEKADLYSLGAMLYEMVTGRPPFVGDDSIAIIGGHINTPPVSPTWHRSDLPPALETLILQLLEKDPEKRPTSAKDVYNALESIEKGDIKESTVETQVPSENPLYRRVFVGRETELKQLHSAFDGAISGQGALMMVVGEPGIGKTAVCEQLSTYVTLRGGKPLVGHCYEEGSLSLPYLAFVEAMRSYVLDREVEDLRKELGTGATDVARIVSEIREKLKVKPREAENPEEDRYRLMQAVTSFLSNAAAVKPMLVILEDLHDADKGTLEMLFYVSRNLSNKRILIVGTYRDVEVDRNHPLSAALAELRRASSFDRILLRGLNVDEVSRMLKSINGEEVPWVVAEAIHNQTEGNPLFVQEVVRYLTEEKLLVRAGGKMITAGSTPLEMNIPEGLRDVIGKRLSNLSEECNRLLSIAAVIGREFRLDVLQKVADISEDEVLTYIEEAKRVAIIEERSAVGAAVTYRFTHAFFRTVLYEENIAPRRIRLHQQVARALEEVYSSRLQEHAAELAEHFSYSSEAADLAKAVTYGEMAAQRAMDVFDYGEAVRLLDQALKVQEVLDSGDKLKRCDLILDLCEALLLIPDFRRIIDIEAPEAFSLAEDLEDSSRAVRACMPVLWSIIMEQSARGITSPLFGEWLEKADQHASPDSRERALVDAYLGVRNWQRGDFTSGLSYFNQALALARRLDDQFTLLQVIHRVLVLRIGPQHLEENVQLAKEFWSIIQSLGMSAIERQGYVTIASTFLIAGLRRDAEKVCAELRGIAQRIGSLSHELVLVFIDSALALLDGKLEEVINLVTSMKTLGEEAGISAYGNAQFSDIRARIFLGKPLDMYDATSRSFEGRLRYCLVQAHLGGVEEVSKILERYVLQRPNVGSTDDEMPLFVDTILLEASMLTGQNQVAEILYDRLKGVGAYISGGVQGPTCISRHLGAAAVLLERFDEAREHYKEAIRVCTEMKFRPELALSRLQFTELLLDHYPDEKKEALEHLDFAIKEFREMKMKPSLERALRRKEILKA